MWIYPEERLAQRHEARDVQHPGGVEVMQSDPLLLRQAQQEGVGGVAETPHVKDAVTTSSGRGWGLTSPDGDALL